MFFVVSEVPVRAAFRLLFRKPLRALTSDDLPVPAVPATAKWNHPSLYSTLLFVFSNSLSVGINIGRTPSRSFISARSRAART